MSLLRKLVVAGVFVVCCPWNTSQAGVYVGFGGGPGYYRPYGGYHRYGWGWGYGGFYRPYGFGMMMAPPIVVGGPPVFVQQPTVVQQPAVVQPAYTPPSPPPAQLPMPTPSTTTSAAGPDVMPAAAIGSSRADFDAALQQLRNGDDKARISAAVNLGRLRAEQAIGPLVKALNSDSSPKVREAAARGLGLVGSSSALSALQYAAQADDDPEVRHSAAFAYETIRSNSRR